MLVLEPCRVQWEGLSRKGGRQGVCSTREVSSASGDALDLAPYLAAAAESARLGLAPCRPCWLAWLCLSWQGMRLAPHALSHPGCGPQQLLYRAGIPLGLEGAPCRASPRSSAPPWGRSSSRCQESVCVPAPCASHPGYAGSPLSFAGSRVRSAGLCGGAGSTALGSALPFRDGSGSVGGWAVFLALVKRERGSSSTSCVAQQALLLGPAGTPEPRGPSGYHVGASTVTLPLLSSAELHQGPAVGLGMVPQRAGQSLGALGCPGPTATPGERGCWIGQSEELCQAQFAISVSGASGHMWGTCLLSWDLARMKSPGYNWGSKSLLHRGSGRAQVSCCQHGAAFRHADPRLHIWCRKSHGWCWDPGAIPVTLLFPASTLHSSQ